jgi:hypothetical protein
LFAVLQSATLQDSAADQSTRKNTRVLVYDISSDATPDKPIGHYVLELPVFDRDGTGGAPDRTAAQSEVLVLNDHQFLLLTRDGNGLGIDDGRPIVFKSIFLVDTTGATNLIGTPYEDGATPLPVVNAGKDLDTAQVTPVTAGELVNMLNTDQLAHLGLTNAVVAAHPVVSTNLLSEKWESFGLVSVFDTLNPDDYFLFVGNDNDFSTLDGVMREVSNPDGTPTGNAHYNSGVVNDSMILVYRVTLPTLDAAAVPEPESIALLISGLAGAWVVRRRRKSKA